MCREPRLRAWGRRGGGSKPPHLPEAKTPLPWALTKRAARQRGAEAFKNHPPKKPTLPLGCFHLPCASRSGAEPCAEPPPRVPQNRISPLETAKLMGLKKCDAQKRVREALGGMRAPSARGVLSIPTVPGSFLASQREKKSPHASLSPRGGWPSQS